MKSRMILLLIVLMLSMNFSGCSTLEESDEVNESGAKALDINSGESSYWQVTSSNMQSIVDDTLFVSLADEFDLSSNSEENVSIYIIEPIISVYDNYENINASDMRKFTVPISYSIRLLDENIALDNLFFDDVGTYYLGLGKGYYFDEVNLIFESRYPIHKEFSDIIQIVIRENDTYIGYIEELTRTPFIYVPKYVEGFHQTDERMGSDCAELAIYGMRRLGYNIPYVGPSGIYDYCDFVSNSYVYVDKSSEYGIYKDSEQNVISVCAEGIRVGDILHFGEQVSVFYKDLGVIGVLDHNDLLIQSYFNGVEIIPLRQSEFYEYPLEIIRFKKSPNNAR